MSIWLCQSPRRAPRLVRRFALLTAAFGSAIAVAQPPTAPQEQPRNQTAGLPELRAGEQVQRENQLAVWSGYGDSDNIG